MNTICIFFPPKNCDLGGITWLETRTKRHWPASSRIQCKSSIFMISVGLRAKTVPRNSGSERPIFQKLAIFHQFAAKMVFQTFFGHFLLCENPHFPNPPPNDKERLKAPTGANQKNDIFWPVECKKPKETNTENHQVCFFPPTSKPMKQVEWSGHFVMRNQRA